MAFGIVSVSAGGWALAAYTDSKITRVNPFSGLKHRPEKVSDAVNYLIVGSDVRDGLSRNELAKLHVGSRATAEGARSDTLMLVHISKHRDKAVVVSIPRDSLVKIPGWVDSQGVAHEARWSKVNAAYGLGGPALVVDTVEQATGVHVDHYVEVNFAGFVRMVDAVGGVDVCTPRAVSDPKSGLRLAAGTHHLDGVDGLKYVRARYIDGSADLGRMKRQQKFVGSMLKEATSSGVLLNPVRLTSFVNAVLDAVTTDEGLNHTDILDLATHLRRLDPAHVTMLTVPIARDDYRPDRDPASGVTVDLGVTIQWDSALSTQLFTALREDGDVVPPAKPGASPAPAAVEVPPSSVRVRVLNGAGVKGLGARAAADLAGAGFAVQGAPGNAATSSAAATVVRYDPRWSRSIKTVLAAVPGATAQPVPGLGATMEVVVGRSWKGATKVTVAAAAPAASGSPAPSLQTTTAAQDICG